MDPARESLETLESKLNDYRANLDTIIDALRAEESKELLKLKEDLEEVIAYFADLVSLKKSEKSENHDEVGQEIGVESSIAPAALNLIDKTCVLTTSKKSLQFGTIRGFGEIDSESLLPSTVKVWWFAQKREEYVSVSSLRLLSPVTPGSIKVGMEAQALFGEDGQWYKCVVKSISDDGNDYLVIYDGYGNEEIVPSHRVSVGVAICFGQLRPVETTHAAGGKKSQKEILTPGGYRIPANLVVKAKDTEAQKAEKRRRLHKLKREQKQAAEELDARNRQVSWQSHTKKTMARSTHRVGTALLHSDGTKAGNKSD